MEREGWRRDKKEGGIKEKKGEKEKEGGGRGVA